MYGSIINVDAILSETLQRIHLLYDKQFIISPRLSLTRYTFPSKEDKLTNKTNGAYKIEPNFKDRFINENYAHVTH